MCMYVCMCIAVSVSVSSVICYHLVLGLLGFALLCGFYVAIPIPQCCCCCCWSSFQFIGIFIMRRKLSSAQLSSNRLDSPSSSSSYILLSLSCLHSLHTTHYTDFLFFSSLLFPFLFFSFQVRSFYFSNDSEGLIFFSQSIVV